MAELFVGSIQEADVHLSRLNNSAAAIQASLLRDQHISPLELLKRLKFEAVGRHPMEDRPLNFIEQVNQTWTYYVAISAARQLLVLHPDAGGFVLAPGAHASRPLDVMSGREGHVGAETFAAVTPRNNGKLVADLKKMAVRPETHRYVFFMSPLYPVNGRQQSLEIEGVQVWSIA